MKKYNRYIQIPANILMGIAVLFFAIGLFGKNTDAEANIGEFDAIKYNEDWTLYQKDEKTEIVLPTEITCEKGEVIRLENTLPLYVSDGMRIFVRSAMQEARIYVDGELRESYVSDTL